MTLREYLKSLGATDAELSAKVVTRMEKALLTDSDFKQFSPNTIIQFLQQASRGLEIANQEAAAQETRAKQATKSLRDLVDYAMEKREQIQQEVAGFKDVPIHDPETKDAVKAYSATLKATQEIFGAENMTESVIIAAVNAGSYMAWRSIAGQKDTPEPSAPPKAGRKLGTPW